MTSKEFLVSPLAPKEENSSREGQKNRKNANLSLSL
jgi:hypothetical protein